MEITGKLTKTLPIQTGVKRDGGEWQKQDVIIETNEQYPKTIAVTCWGDKVQEVQNIPIGSTVKMFINIESREYNEKYYTDVKAWKIEVQAAQTQPAAQPQQTTPIEDKTTGLPF